MEDVAYSFDMDAFPALPPPTVTTAATANSTNAPSTPVQPSAAAPVTPSPSSAISGLTKEMINKQISDQLAAFQQAQKVQDSTFKDRMQTIEDNIAGINDRLDAITKKLCSQVLKHLTAPDGPLARQSSKVDILQSTVKNLSDMLQKLVTATDATKPASSPPSPPCKKATTASPSKDDVQMS